MAENKFKRILIIQTAFIGDLILATGVIEKIHAYYPECEIDVLVKRENRSVLLGHPYIRDILIFDKRNKISELFKTLSRVRRKRYDLVINLHRFFSSGFFTLFAKSRISVGFDKNPMSFFFSESFPHKIGDPSRIVHEIERNHLLVEKYTDQIAGRPALHLKEIDYSVVKLYQKQPYVCIAPTSVWYTKQFPEEKWVELIKLIPDEYAIHLLGAASDISPCERIRSNTRRNNIKVLAGSLSLNQSAALMQGAVINFVNDSAPMHLASSVNAPVCAIYCSTVPDFGFGPLSDFSRIVQVDEPLSCKPCNLHGFKNCPEGHFKCALDIDVSKLLAVFQEAATMKQKIMQK